MLDQIENTFWELPIFISLEKKICRQDSFKTIFDNYSHSVYDYDYVVRDRGGPDFEFCLRGSTVI